MCYVKSGLQLNTTLLFDSHTLIGEKLLTNLRLIIAPIWLFLRNQMSYVTLRVQTCIHSFLYVWWREKKDKDQFIKTANILKDLYIMYEGNCPRQFVFKNIQFSIVTQYIHLHFDFISQNKPGMKPFFNIYIMATFSFLKVQAVNILFQTLPPYILFTPRCSVFLTD